MTGTDLTVKLYERLRASRKPRVMEHWHASSIAQCPRSHYLARLGTPTTNQPSGAKILRWEAGHLMEAVVRPHLKEIMPNLQSNIRLTSDLLDLTGEYDNFDPDTGTLWEIKTVGPRAVRYRRAAETRHHLRDDRPYLHYEWQQHAYVLLLAEQDIIVKQIGYLFITLEGLLVPYVTSVQPELLDAVLDRLQILNIHWGLQTQPPCFCQDQDDPLYKPQYQWCDYRDGDSCCGVKKEQKA